MFHALSRVRVGHTHIYIQRERERAFTCRPSSLTVCVHSCVIWCVCDATLSTFSQLQRGYVDVGRVRLPSNTVEGHQWKGFAHTKQAVGNLERIAVSVFMKEPVSHSAVHFPSSNQPILFFFVVVFDCEGEIFFMWAKLSGVGMCVRV